MAHTSLIASYVFGLLLARKGRASGRLGKLLLALSIVISVAPLLLIRVTGLWSDITHAKPCTLLVPVGLSFYSLQIISYLSDIFSGKLQPQANFLKYALYISFFPQIIQGPIPRCSQLGHQLWEGNRFRTSNIDRGFQLIVWGFFLKFMIADKAGIVAVHSLENKQRARATV